MSPEFNKLPCIDDKGAGNESVRVLPKIIWTYWDQGLDNAPDLVNACVKSWQMHNNDWEVMLLDRYNVKKFFDVTSVVDKNRKDLKIQHISDLIRINLLTKFGGVWADATCLCRKPLNEWLYDYMTSGFFAFRSTGKDRILANWFLAAVPNCHLIKHFTKSYNDFWTNNHFSNQNTWFGKKVVSLLRSPLGENLSRSRWWLSPVFVSWLKVYPYPIFHYFFEKAVFTDELSRIIWEDGRKFNARVPRSAKKMGLLSLATTEHIDRLRKLDAPLYKLDWRLPYVSGSENTLLDVILSEHDT